MSLFEQIMLGPLDRQERGLIQGLAVGVVTDNKDPEGLARVRVRLPWLKDGEVSHWARSAMPMTGNDIGTFFLPEIGDEVLLGAEQGDPSHLYVLGMLWNGQAKPPETNGDGNNHKRFIRTRSRHELMFVDDPAAPLAELKLEDGKKLTLSRDGVEITDGKNRIVIDSNGSSITIESSAELKIKSQTVAIEAGASMELKSSGTLTIKGSMVQIN
jgi:uncharacterized protein involved in type VI secretion and phage assembly